MNSKEDDAEQEIALGPQTLEVHTNSLKTLNPSRIIKISNIFDREMQMTVEMYEELKDDFEAEM